MQDGTVRIARGDDLPRVVAIYNHYIEKTPITFDMVPISVAGRRAWLEAFGSCGPHRLFVAEIDGTVAGYASSCAFRAKAAYATTVEVTVYLDPERTGRGLGGQLYAALFDALSDSVSAFNVFRYLTFRAVGAALTSLLIAFIVGPMLIRYFEERNVGKNSGRARAVHDCPASKNQINFAIRSSSRRGAGREHRKKAEVP